MQKPGKGGNRSQVRPAQQPTPQPTIQAQHRVSVLTQKFEGPLPPPDILQRYDEVANGAALIIIQMGKDQGAHRQQMEIEGLRADIAARDKQLEIENSRISGILFNERLSVFLGWTVAVLCAGAGAYAMVMDKPGYVTIAFLSLPVAGIIKAFTNKSGK